MGSKRITSAEHAPFRQAPALPCAEWLLHHSVQHTICPCVQSCRSIADPGAQYPGPQVLGRHARVVFQASEFAIVRAADHSEAARGWKPRVRTSMGIPCPSETGPTAPPSPAHTANTTTASALLVASGRLRLFSWSERGQGAAARHDGIEDQFCLFTTRSALSKAALVRQLPGHHPLESGSLSYSKDLMMPTGEAWYHSKVDSLRNRSMFCQK